MTPATKIRPYRVDYFDVPEMQGDKALVRSVIVRCPTAKQAKEFVSADGRFIIKAYRFYKKLGKPKKQVFLPIEKLFSGYKAVEVMEQVEAWRNRPVMVAQPIDITLTIAPDHAAADPQYGVHKGTFYKNNEGTQVQLTGHGLPMPEPTTGPDSPATKAIVEDLNGMLAHDAHEQTFDTFVAAPLEAAENAVNDLGLTPAAQADMDAIAKQHDDALCPKCGIGIDNNGDGDCAVCTSPAYQQPLPCEQVTNKRVFCWLAVTLVVTALVALYFFLHH